MDYPQYLFLLVEEVSLIHLEYQRDHYLINQEFLYSLK